MAFAGVAELNTFLFNIPRAKATITSGTQTFTTSVTTIVTGLASVFTGGGAAVATDGITVQAAGDYAVMAWHNWVTNDAGRRVIRIQVNGADLSPAEANTADPVAAANSGPSLSTVLRLNAGDKVQMTGLQSTGGDLILNSAMLSVSLVGLTL